MFIEMGGYKLLIVSTITDKGGKRNEQPHDPGIEFSKSNTSAKDERPVYHAACKKYECRPLHLSDSQLTHIKQFNKK